MCSAKLVVPHSMSMYIDAAVWSQGHALWVLLCLIRIKRDIAAAWSSKVSALFQFNFLYCCTHNFPMIPSDAQ